MGASKSKTNSNSKALEEPVKPEALPNSAKHGSEPEVCAAEPAKQVSTIAEPVKLPTSSWRELLKDAPDAKQEVKPLNPTAKPFVPNQAIGPSEAAVPAVRKVAKLTKPSEDEPEPEWMQYLSKKLSASGGQPSTTSAKGGQRRQNAGASSSCASGALGESGGGSVRRRDPGEVDAAVTPSGSNIVIHTESYLKLLKEGSSKKKASHSIASATKVSKEKGPVDRNGLAAFSSFCSKQVVAQSESSSDQKRSGNAVNIKTPSVQEFLHPTEEPLRLQVTQDDISVSKMLRDEDLSDPAYYSDADPTDMKSSGSVHRFGRRPRLAKASIRTYVMQDMSYRLDEAVGMLLLRLQRFTDIQRTFSGSTCDATPAQGRRFVIGLKEVSRRTKQAKIECLLVAPDIEEDANSGGLDDRMRELLASAYQNKIPVIFALSRARMGKALGKSLQISVLGILDARGAQCYLKEAKQLADECRQTWLTRFEK